MRSDGRMTRAQLALLADSDLRALRSVTRQLADATQRQAAVYQRSAAAFNREINRRRRAAKASS